MSITHARHIWRHALVATVLAGIAATPVGGAASTRAAQSAVPAAAGTIDEAQYLFYTGRYNAAAEMALAIRASAPDDLATFELRTSSIHFQIKREMGDGEDKERAFKACANCPALKAAFLEDTAKGRALARSKVDANANDATALFFLGKINLNYIWLQLGTIGQRTGWNGSWEARRSLDAVLKLDPAHVRARIARAWIDYIVDTRMTRGFRWILGGGNKKRALATVRETAAGNGDRFAKTEAGFAHWEMEVREKNIPEAVVAARALAADFPENQELIKFLAKHGSGR